MIEWTSIEAAPESMRRSDDIWLLWCPETERTVFGVLAGQRSGCRPLGQRGRRSVRPDALQSAQPADLTGRTRSVKRVAHY